MFSTIARFTRRQIRSIRKRLVPRDFVAETRRRMPDLSEADVRVMDSVRRYTMVDADRLYAFMEATRYVARNDVPGAIVECGVWRGGATMASIRTLQALGRADRDYYLYDTFEGMSCPGEHDRRHDGEPAVLKFRRRRLSEDSSDWCRAELEAVKRAVLSTGYDPARVRFVKGKVEETIPGVAPAQIAVLRLDTDWYESTKHELEHLYPRLSCGGVLLVDDYGHWQGARKAVDEYFAGRGIPMLLNRSDYTGRVGVKISA
jgi:hypothetical protein